ncbi:MAG: ABC transporter substrate-binding protein [Chloroflexi bacterium]|nr:ABC transporter substrate-binding protein [Chloroflexota bacterium]MBV9597813.1 ABC transporter substrate-binding protein [Chloroflexota bacterium]
MITRRRALRAFSLTGAAALLAACGPAAPSPGPTSVPTAAPPPTTAPAAATQTPAVAAKPTVPATAQPTSAAAAASGQQPKRGGNLTSTSLPLARLDAHCFCGGDAFLGIWDTLIGYDDKSQPMPNLVQSWEANQQLTQITLSLRQGVLFHSGRELTSEDVKYNFTRTMDAAKAPIYSGFVRPFLDSVETPDKYTAVVKTRQPWPGVWDFLRFLWITDSEADQKQADSDRAVGTGPFVLQEYAQSDHAVLVRNDKYWQSAVPYLDQITMRFFTDPQALLVAFDSGAVDIVVNPLARDLQRYLNDQNVNVYRPSVPINYRGYVAHSKNPPTSEKTFRQALSYALDRERANQTVWQGLGTPMTLLWNSANVAYDAAKDKAYAFDLDKAKSLVQQSGVTDTSIEIEYSANSPDDAQVAQIWQQDLAKIGVNATLRSQEQAVWFQRYNTQAYKSISMVLAPTLPWNPASVLGGPYTKPDGNAAAFESPEWTDVVRRIQTEADPAQQKVLYAQMNDYLLDQAFHLTWGAQPLATITPKKVQGVELNPFPTAPYNRTWLA